MPSIRIPRGYRPVPQAGIAQPIRLEHLYISLLYKPCADGWSQSNIYTETLSNLPLSFNTLSTRYMLPIFLSTSLHTSTSTSTRKTSAYLERYLYILNLYSVYTLSNYSICTLSLSTYSICTHFVYLHTLSVLPEYARLYLIRYPNTISGGGLITLNHYCLAVQNFTVLNCAVLSSKISCFLYLLFSALFRVCKKLYNFIFIWILTPVAVDCDFWSGTWYRNSDKILFLLTYFSFKTYILYILTI